ncbi:hypothetical protein [Providencia rettgeri]|uniref:hypothetical protein n=1 Tax=Providencia rettgeri TaxID=587 RepID=UPI00301A11FD
MFVFESTSKFSAISNVIAYLYQLGFSNIDIEKCHIAKTQQEIAAYFHCYNNQQ